MKKQFAWEIGIDTYIEIIELAQKHGKVQGDSMQEEFNEVMRKKRNNFKFRGLFNEAGKFIASGKGLIGKKILDLRRMMR